MNKTTLRPSIPSAFVNDAMTATEQFQNGVLRPILKLQHTSIVTLFKYHLSKSNTLLRRMEVFQKNEYIQNAIAKNQALKNHYIGMVTGLFTDEEFIVYLENASAYNKRIVQMTIQRLQDSL